MKVVVCGLGHVGSVTAACLLSQNHAVVGVDTDPGIRACVARGVSPIREPQVDDLLGAGRAAGRLTVAASAAEHADADAIMVCVGTPGTADGRPDLTAVIAGAGALGAAVRHRSSDRKPILLVFRSTMLPGSMRNVILPAIAAAAGEAPGARYDVAYNPEFTREGSAVADCLAPARIVVGERVTGGAGTLHRLYRDIAAPLFTTSFEAAELTKYADNVFHALKIAFANEIGRAAQHCGVEPAAVFDLFRADTKLNLSSAYLRPGGAFGGPCLPKDVRAFAAHLAGLGVAAPVIGHILSSNDIHRAFLLGEIERRVAPPACLLLVGLSFKAGTDDLRESPHVELALALIARGYDLAIYDSDLAGHRAALPPRLAAALLAHVPCEARYDLVVAAKNDPALAAVGAASPIYSINGR